MLELEPFLLLHSDGCEKKFMSVLQRNQSCGSNSTGSDESLCGPDPFMQNLFVLCHGEQVKYLDDAARPWDPPLTERGKMEAWRVGREIRLEDWNVTRVVTSPFLRCVQTAVEVIAGLCLLPQSVEVRESGNGSSAPVSTIKASIECGMAEMISGQWALNPSEVAPWTLGLAELYSMLPTETHDPSFQPIRDKLPPSWESVADVQTRYTSTFQKIANRYPDENILCITDGEGVMQSVSMTWPRFEVHGVAHCAYSHGQRPNFGDGSNLNNDWELLTESGLASGVFFSPSNS